MACSMPFYHCFKYKTACFNFFLLNTAAGCVVSMIFCLLQPLICLTQPLTCLLQCLFIKKGMVKAFPAELDE
jgi:hypothetical protein